MSDTDALPDKLNAVNRVKRWHDRGFCDHETVHALPNSAILCHVSYVFDGQPYCTPTLAWREGTTLCWQTRSLSWRGTRNASRPVMPDRRSLPALPDVA
jgi:hypothetical protein